MTCCIVGHRDAPKTAIFKRKIEDICVQLIQRGVNVFLIGSIGNFNSLVLSCLRELKTKVEIPFSIEYVRAEYEYIDDDYTQYLLNIYDKTYMPDCVKKANRAAYIVRNQYMIDNSDICLFYYNSNKTGKSGTRMSYLYASKKGKEIINLYDI